MDDARNGAARAAWRDRMYEVIFGVGTRAGQLFDVAVIVCIVLSILVVMLDSVAEISREYGAGLRALEWLFTILFTIEYGLRILSARRPARYARSFFGVIDLLSILPTYLSLVITGSQSLLVIRTLRLLRIFRVLKLARFLGEQRVLIRALKASKFKITVFLVGVLCVVVVMGASIYLIEGEATGFTSIPKSMYWAVVTMTTVGYGDIAPGSPLGQAMAAVLMVLGYGIIAVPTGIVSAELVHVGKVSEQACAECSAEGHDVDAAHCKFCGTKL